MEIGYQALDKKGELGWKILTPFLPTYLAYSAASENPLLSKSPWLVEREENYREDIQGGQGGR